MVSSRRRLGNDALRPVEYSDCRPHSSLGGSAAGVAVLIHRGGHFSAPLANRGTSRDIGHSNPPDPLRTVGSDRVEPITCRLIRASCRYSFLLLPHVSNDRLYFLPRLNSICKKSQ